MFLLIKFLNPDFNNNITHRCLYFHDEKIINYVQSIFNIYNNFINFFNNYKSNAKEIDIFQISIDDFTEILNSKFSTSNSDIRDIITNINKNLSTLIEAFKYLQSLYLQGLKLNKKKSFNNFFGKIFNYKKDKINGGNNNIIKYNYNNKIYNRKIRIDNDSNKNYIIINKNKIYL